MAYGGVGDAEVVVVFIMRSQECMRRLYGIE